MPTRGFWAKEILRMKMKNFFRITPRQANLPTLLTQFPRSFEKIIDLSRTPNIEHNPAEIKATANKLTQEILKASLIIPA